MTNKLVIEYVSQDDIELLKQGKTTKEKQSILIHYHCTVCNKEQYCSLSRFNRPLCHKHKIIDSGIKKYGSEEAMKADILYKTKQAVLNKYGVDNYFKTEESKSITRNRTKEEWQKRNEKLKETVLERYGVDNISKLDSIKNKKKDTTRTHFDVDYSLQIDIPNREQKRRDTFIKKYNCVAPMQVKAFRDKQINTVQSKGPIFRPFNYKYLYDNIYFDSSWELYYYIYLQDNNISFTYHNDAIEYFIDDKKHIYYPDFNVNGQLIEIKGNQFFDENNNLIDFYKSGDILYEKMNIMKTNNVKILKEEDLKPIFNFIDNKYGKGYVKSFKVS